MQVSKPQNQKEELSVKGLYQEKAARVNTNCETTLKGAVKLLDAEALTTKASEGLLALSLELGLEVLRQMMEEDVTALAGEKGKHQKDRRAYRHGHEDTKVVCGGGKVRVSKPRVRSKEGVELGIPSLALFQGQDPLNKAILSHVLAGVSTRKYARLYNDADGACTSKSEASRRFIKGMKEAMSEFFMRGLDEEYAVIMLDGMGFGDTTVIAAMGITTDGHKRMLSIAEGGSENSSVVNGLLADIIERGVDPDKPRLCVLDGSKALSKAVRDTFGKRALIQRCQVHKKRNVLEHLPESEKANVSLSMANAYREYEYEKAKTALDRLADNLENRYPKAAASIREGLEETLAVHRLGVPGLLRQTLCSTNPMESANSVCAGIVRRVSRFKDGEDALRHAAAGFMEAEKGFHRVRGYRQMPILISALKGLFTDSGGNDILTA
jgi:transposase-like protein